MFFFISLSFCGFKFIFIPGNTEILLRVVLYTVCITCANKFPLINTTVLTQPIIRQKYIKFLIGTFKANTIVKWVKKTTCNR